MQRRRPAPGATRRKTVDGPHFLSTGNAFGAPRQLRHAASFCPRCPCSQSSPSIWFCFFSLFFHRFSQCELSKCPNSFIFGCFSGEIGYNKQPYNKLNSLSAFLTLHSFSVNFWPSAFALFYSVANKLTNLVNTLKEEHLHSYISLLFNSHFID